MEKKVKLGFTHGNSDKVYIMEIIELDDGYMLKTQYGRRNNVNHTKYYPTTGPTIYDHVRYIFNRILCDKRGKGYVIEHQ